MKGFSPHDSDECHSIDEKPTEKVRVFIYSNDDLDTFRPGYYLKDGWFIGLCRKFYY